MPGQTSVICRKVNPFGVSYNSKATLKRIFTDKESAKNVAEYLISHTEKIQYNNEDYYSSVRRQWTFIKMLTKQLEDACNLAEVELLKSFKVIGTYSAAWLMIEILSVESFSSVKKLASFFGIHPVFKQSRDGLSGFKMSKRERKEPDKYYLTLPVLLLCIILT